MTLLLNDQGYDKVSVSKIDAFIDLTQPGAFEEK
jgi:hypothetical protein